MAGGAFTPIRENYPESSASCMTFFSIFLVMMGAAMFGADQANYGLIYGFKSFQEYWCPTFNFSSEDVPDCSAIVNMKPAPPEAWQNFITFGFTLVTCGMMVGALIPGPALSHHMGRRFTISFGGLLCTFGCVMVAFLSGTNRSVYMLGRFVTGLGVGISCMVLPMYNAEIATLKIRGTTGSLFQFMVNIGCLVAAIVLSKNGANGVNWQQGFMLPGYFGILVGIGVWICPESPRFLLMQNKKEKAHIALQRVRKGEVTEELDYIDSALEEERQEGQLSYCEMLSGVHPGLRKRIFVACWLQVAQQITGVNAFLGFQTDIFGAAGYSQDQIDHFPDGPAMVIQWIFIVGCFIGMMLIDSKWGGRRKQLLIASVFTGPPLIVAAIVKFSNGNPHITAYMVFIFMFGFQFAWGFVPWLYPSEIFEMNERERAISLSTFSGFLFNMIVGQVTQTLFYWNEGGMYLIFGLLNVTNVIFVLIFVKETKGVPLEEVPALFLSADAKSQTELAPMMMAKKSEQIKMKTEGGFFTKVVSLEPTPRGVVETTGDTCE